MEVREDLAHQALSLFSISGLSPHMVNQATKNTRLIFLPSWATRGKNFIFPATISDAFDKDSDCLSWGHRSCLGPVTVALKEDNTMGLN